MATAIEPLSFSNETILPQKECPLFTKIPGEIRNSIFEYALAQYEDLSEEYEHQTVYRRPECVAPQRIDIQLLQTCKLIYTETWFLPWTLAEHSIYFTSSERRPERYTELLQLKAALKSVYLYRGEQKTSHVRVYAQLYALEGSESISELLDLDHFYPRVITLTIRHTDWWWWEADEPLKLDGWWVSNIRLPSCIEEFRITLESLERKKSNVDDIARQAVRKWNFETKDGTKLSADKKRNTVQRWTGSSTWNDETWTRDETKPGEIDYYAVTVSWKPDPSIKFDLYPQELYSPNKVEEPSK